MSTVRSRRPAAVALLAVSAALSAVLAGCGGAEETSDAAEAPKEPPYVKEFPWGTFELAPRIAEKLMNGEELNVVNSSAGLSAPIYGPQFSYAFPLGIEEANDTYSVRVVGKEIGPAVPDVVEQADQIRALLQAGQIDCLGLTVSDAGLAPVINQAIDAGVPVFTTSGDEPASNRFGTFATDKEAEGRLAAQTTVDFFEAKDIPLETVALTSGGATTPFAQERMKGFYDELMELVPDVEFLNTPDNALDTTFDPAETYSKVKAFVQGNPDVQVLYQTDIAGGTLDRVVNDLGRKGEVYVIGHNVDQSTLVGIADGTQIATLDQNYLLQAKFPALACAAYFDTGEILPNDNVSTVIDADNVAEAQEVLKMTTEPNE